MVLLISGAGGVALAEYIPYGQDNSKGVFICGLYICTPSEYKIFQKAINDAQLGITHQFIWGYDFNSCGFGNCFVYNHGMDENFETTTPPNWNFDVFMPDGTCNITGVITNIGGCTSNSIILSNDNFTALKNNVAIMTVLNIHTVHPVKTQNYCPLAEFTLLHEDGYSYKIKGLEQYVLPNYCVVELHGVPEFSHVLTMAFVASMISVIAITTRLRIK
jgi:hypothetical protein